MPRAKTLYVRDEDSAIWEQAANVAAQEGVSLSEFVTAAVRGQVERLRPPAFEELSADSMEPFTAGTARIRTHTFYGRWIITDMQSGHPGTMHDVWNIAITSGGVFAVQVVKAGTPLFGTDPKLDDLARTFGIPDDVVAAALKALEGVNWVVKREI